MISVNLPYLSVTGVGVSDSDATCSEDVEAHLDRVWAAGCDHPAWSLNGRLERIVCSACTPEAD